MRRLQGPVVRYLVLLALLAAIVQITITSGSFASSLGDWPTYLHDSRRQSNNTDETVLSVSNAGQLVKLWSFQTADAVAASAAVVNNVVYFGSWDGNEDALDATSGVLIWKTCLGLTSTTNCNLGTTGITSAATVQNGVVYVGG